MQKPKCFYYIAHKDRLQSILTEGIFSRTQINKKENTWQFKIQSFLSKPKVPSIHDEGIVQTRQTINFKNRSLWDYANLYFQVRNPMLYRVIKNYGQENIVILQVSSDIIDSHDVGITDGNAASNSTQIFEDVKEGLNHLTREQFDKTYWNELDDSKRKIMAELLVYEHIPKEKIMTIFTASETIANQIRREFIGPLNVIVKPEMFFLPEYQNKISQHITLAKGDMFFSKMQTFTISVNTVGVMGKGLASRAKYQFPDVYVRYQDICREKKLIMGTPYLYKREGDFTRLLLEETNSVITENGSRWFLLFPTKTHWKTKSPIDGIEKGLKWLCDHYESLEVQSLAMPSLGCGLGGLNWKDVGPLMCRYLNKMNIPSMIYLPGEQQQIPKEQLDAQFLLE